MFSGRLSKIKPPRGGGSGQEPGLLLGELGLGQDAGGVQLGELLAGGRSTSSVRPVAAAGGGSAAAVCGAAGAHLAAGDPAGDRGGGAGDHGGAGGGLGGAADQAGAAASRIRAWRSPSEGVGGGEQRGAGLGDHRVRDAFGEHQLAVGGAHRLGEAGGPDVLEEQRRGGEPGSSASATASRSASESRPLTAPSSRTKAAATSGESSWSSRMATLPSASLRDHREVDDADEALLDELGEGRGDLAGEAVAGEVDHDVLDGSECSALGHGRLRGDVGTGIEGAPAARQAAIRRGGKRRSASRVSRFRWLRM